MEQHESQKSGESQEMGGCGESPIDAAALLESCLGNPGLVRLVLGKYESQLRSDLVALEDAVRAKDPVAASSIAHALKGASAVVAAREVQRVAAALEACGKAGTLPTLEPLLAELRGEVERCLAALPVLRRDSGGAAGPSAPAGEAA